MWVTFQWKDALDLILVAGLLYAVLLLLRRTHSRFIFTGISLLLVLYGAARFLNLYLTTTLFQAFLAFFAIIIAVIFQRELRSFVEWLSGWARWSRSRRVTASRPRGRPDRGDAHCSGPAQDRRADRFTRTQVIDGLRPGRGDP